MSNALRQIFAARDYWITARDPLWPDLCACCGDVAETTLPIEYRETDSDGQLTYQCDWRVPYCSACRCHVDQGTLRDRENPSTGAKAFIGLVALAVVGACLIINSAWPVFLAIIAGLAVEAIRAAGRWKRAREAKKPTCTATGPAVVCLNHHQYRGEVHTFSFTNAAYTEAFRELNRGG